MSPILFVLFCKREDLHSKERKDAEMEEEFIHGIKILNASLQAGMSMENAWIDVEDELCLTYGNTSSFYLEVQEMNRLVQMNIPIEKQMLEFAYRSGIEDIISFAEIFHYAKRSGGNWKRIIDSTVSHISEKYEAYKEIQVMISGKRMEQNVMNVIPLGMLAFLQVFAWEYMSVLYHNRMGVICMTIGLLGYGAAILLSEKILRIKV